jgi:hypothetical protein
LTTVDGLSGIAYIYPVIGLIADLDRDLANVVTAITVFKEIRSSILTYNIFDPSIQQSLDLKDVSQ